MALAGWLGFSLALTSLALGCARAEAGANGSAPPPRASVDVHPPRSVPAPTPSIEPVRVEPEVRRLVSAPVVALEVPGFRPATLVVPSGATSKRPVVVALHGNFDRPEWQCGVWQAVTDDGAFVLCPRGIPRRDAPAALDRWEYASAKAMRTELEAGLLALRARFPDFVDDGPIVFIGFSLGAIYGASLVHAEPARFSRVVFIEGGVSTWTPASAKKFSQAGGQRLIMACGQPDCLSRVKRLAPSLERAGLATRVGGSAKAGHTYDGEVADVVRENWSWFVEGDARWAPK
jgi:predicted esterase